jgi:uncharacterized protein YndB with AHSA1/START domain
MSGLVPLILAAALAAEASHFTPTAEPISKTFPGVVDTSFVADNGDRTLRLAIETPANPERVWQVFTTADGWKALSVPTAYVDFREGGVIETSYRAGAPKGDPDNIKNQIIAYVPERLLVFHNVQAPRNFSGAALFARITTSIRIEPLDSGGSRVTISGDGYGPGAGFDDLYGKFLQGNAYTLAGLRDALAKGAGGKP